MQIKFLIFVVTSCYAVEFSSRPTNVSILLIHFTHQAINRSVVLAPFGIWSLMSGLSFGAHGDTRREIFRSFLLFTDQTRFTREYTNLTDILFKGKMSGVSASNRNYFFMDTYTSYIERDFKEMLEENFDTIAKTFDFQDQNTATSANGLIEKYSSPVKNVFDSDDFKESTIIMSNVIFFKGEWSLPFNLSNTALESVTSFDGKPIGTVNMMQMRGKIRFSHMESMKASVMELPYGSDGKYCMLVITPDPGIGIHIVYKNFEKVTFRDIFDKLQSDVNESGIKEINVKLPRFAKRSRLQLQKPLNDMGIYDAFEPNYARFGRMSRESIYIGAIEHNAVIIVTESGTVAYATTPGINDPSFAVEETKAMPPLIFFIMEKPTATVIFGGIFP